MEHCVTRQDRITRPFGESGLSYVPSASRDSSAKKWTHWLLPNARRILMVLLILEALTARADVTLFVEAPINFLGHVRTLGCSLLMDTLCSDDHIHMRWCHAGGRRGQSLADTRGSTDMTGWRCLQGLTYSR